MTPNGAGDSIGKRPTQTHNSTIEGSVLDSNTISPVLEDECFSVMREKQVAAIVPVLFGRRCPATIGRPTMLLAFIALSAGVASLAVHPVNRVPGSGGQPHVLQECREGVSPPLADHNATLAVAGVRLLLFGIVASVEHRAPCAALLGFPQSTLGTKPAAACSACSRLECYCTNELLSPTIAPAQPLRVTGLVCWPKGQNGPPSEPLAGEVLQLGTAAGRLAFSHDVPFHRKGATGQSPPTLHTSEGSFNIAGGPA